MLNDPLDLSERLNVHWIVYARREDAARPTNGQADHRLPYDELKERWSTLFDKESPAYNKVFLVMRTAFPAYLKKRKGPLVKAMIEMNISKQDRQENRPFRESERQDVEDFRRLTSDQRGPGGAPERNTNNLQHGVYANRFLGDDDRPLFDALIRKLRADFKFNESSDFIQVELVAMYFLKLGRALESGDWDIAQKLDQMLRGHLKDLKATKIAREGDEPRGPESSPAEWASSLLQQWNESQKSKRVRKPKNAEKTSDNTVED